MVVSTTALQHQHAVTATLRQPGGQHAARRACANDDVVEVFVAHEDLARCLNESRRKL